MTAWVVIFSVGLGTYAFRAAAFATVGVRELPGWTRRPLAHVGPAAIGALVGGMLFTDHGRIDVADWAELCSVVAAFVTVRRTGDVARGLLVGFVVLWGVTAVTG